MAFLKRYNRITLFLLAVVIALLSPRSVPAGERRVVRVGCPVQDGFTMKAEDGSYYGYTCEYLEELSQYTGWRYEYVEVPGSPDESFPRLMEMLETGEIDLLGGFVHSEDLEEHYGYAGVSYGVSCLSLSVPDADSPLTSENYCDRPLKTAVVGDGDQIRKLREYAVAVGLDLELLICRDGREQERLLYGGQADAMLRPEVSVPEDCRYIAKFSQMPFYLVTAKSDSELLRQLNAGIMALHEANPGLIGELHEKYFSRTSSRILFTDEEEEYMRQTGPLRVAVLDGKAPIQSVAPGTGEAVGISRELFNYISEKTGLQFQYVCVLDPKEYRELLLKDQVDLAIGVPIDRRVEQHFALKYTRPYLTVSPVLVFHRGVDPGALEGKTYALYDSYGDADARAGATVRYRTVEAAMEAVEEGRADYTYMNNLSFQYCMNKRHFSNVSVVALTDSKEQSVGIGIMRRDDAVLEKILNKVIAFLPVSGMQTMLYSNSVSYDRLSLRDYMRENPLYVLGAVLGICLLVFGGILCYLRDKYRMSQKIALENERYRQLAQVVGECVFEYDYQADRLTFSQEGARMFGVDERIGQYSVFSAGRAEKVGIPEEETLFGWLREGGEGAKDVQLLSNLSTKRWYRVVSKVIRDPRGNPVYMVGRIRDVQDEVEEKAQLVNRAQKDGLTGVYNAATIRERINEALAEQKSGGAFLIMDVDRFKEINDKFGHLAGDHALIQIGSCMASVFGGENPFGRLGGDEFVAFLRRTDSREEAAALAEEFKRQLGAMPSAKSGDKISVSMGIALRKTESSFDDLYAKADGLLYEVKRDGRDGVRIA